MLCNRGDVLPVLFPNSNLRSTKRRPALAVQASNLGTGLSQTVVAMISSNIARAGHPSRVTVSLSSPDGKLTGLLSNSVIMTDNLAPVLDNEIERVIGARPEMGKVDAALRKTLGL